MNGIDPLNDALTRLRRLAHASKSHSHDVPRLSNRRSGGNGGQGVGAHNPSRLARSEYEKPTERVHAELEPFFDRSQFNADNWKRTRPN